MFHFFFALSRVGKSSRRQKQHSVPRCSLHWEPRSWRHIFSFDSQFTCTFAHYFTWIGKLRIQFRSSPIQICANNVDMLSHLFCFEPSPCWNPPQVNLTWYVHVKPFLCGMCMFSLCLSFKFKLPADSKLPQEWMVHVWVHVVIGFRDLSRVYSMPLPFKIKVHS